MFFKRCHSVHTRVAFPYYGVTTNRPILSPSDGSFPSHNSAETGITTQKTSPTSRGIYCHHSLGASVSGPPLLIIQPISVRNSFLPIWTTAVHMVSDHSNSVCQTLENLCIGKDLSKFSIAFQPLSVHEPVSDREEIIMEHVGFNYKDKNYPLNFFPQKIIGSWSRC